MSSLRKAAEALADEWETEANELRAKNRGGAFNVSVHAAGQALALLNATRALRAALSQPNEQERRPESDQPTYTELLFALDRADKEQERLREALGRALPFIECGYTLGGECGRCETCDFKDELRALVSEPSENQEAQ